MEGGEGGRKDEEDNVACPPHPALPSAPADLLHHHNEILASRIWDDNNMTNNTNRDIEQGREREKEHEYGTEQEQQ